jgi:hypothetical protein
MKASQEEIEKKVKELNEIGREISNQDNKPSHNRIEEKYIQEIRKMLEEGYYAKVPSDWRLGSNGSQGDVLAWRAARYIKGNLTDFNELSGSGKIQSNDIVFSDFQEAKEWALKNPGKAIIRSSNGTGFMVKK